MATAKPSARTSKSKPGAGQFTPATVDLRQPIIVLRSHIWVAAALALIACTLMAWQQMRKPRLYLANATLLIETGDRMAALSEVNESTQELTVGTRLNQLRSPELAEQVYNSLTPEERLLVAGPFRPGATDAMKEQAARGTVRGAVNFDRNQGTMLISVSAVHQNPAAAALLANRFAEVGISYAFDRTTKSNDASLKFLKDQAEEIRKKAEVAERELQDYRQKYNLVSLEDNTNIVVDNLKSLNASATGAQVARMGAESRLQQAESIIQRGSGPEALASLPGFELLAGLTRQLADLRAKRAVMAERYGRRHPLMQENERSTTELERMCAEQMKTALTSLRDQRDKAVSEEGKMAEKRALAEKAALDLSKIGVEYNILRRAVDSYKASYSQTLARLNDASISSQLRGVNMKISELAQPPSDPFSPNPRKTLLITGALALVILFGYPFAAELFFGRIRSATDIEFHLDADVLGEIGSVRRVKETDRPTLVKTEHDEGVSEQFRALYSQLTLSSKIDPPKSILVTSTVPSEGKSFVAANLAQCFVAHSRRTLLIDADLRRPSQHRQFGLDNKAGFLRWLEQDGQIEGDLLKNEKLGIVEIYPGLHLLRTGGLSRKASELMDGGRLPELFAALQRQFDVLIFDTPPAGIFPDAVSFAKVCHEFIYICRFNTASRQAVRNVLDRLKQTELDFPGVVLNAMPSGFGGSYYYTGYSYHRSKYYGKRYQETKA